MSQFILALDQGTTSSRSIVFDHHGAIVAVAQREFAQHFPASGWVEHDAAEIWETQLATIHEVLAKAGLQPSQLAAVGITNQRETTVVWDRATGEPIHRAIVWQDRRTAERCALLTAAGHEPAVTAATGLRLDPYFSGTKLAWILDRVPGARERAARGELAFGTIDSWLVWNLTGGRHHVTDPSNASRTLLLNLRTGDWDPAMLALLEVPAAVLPTLVPSSIGTDWPGPRPLARIGEAEVPITGIAGDQQAALFGQACFTPGMAKNTYGTGCFLLMNTGGTPVASRHRLLGTVGWGLHGATTAGMDLTYALEGSVFVGGAVVQWLRDGLGIIERAADVEALAASVPDTGGVCCVPAFTGLGSPHWDSEARGLLVGLSRGTTRAHIARAALESIAWQSAELLAAMQADAPTPLRELRVDGGATANDLLMQFQADVLGVPVVRPRITETTALGAAYLAGLGTGYWHSVDEVAAHWQVDRRFVPSMPAGQVAARLQQWRRAVERARDWHRD